MKAFLMPTLLALTATPLLAQEGAGPDPIGSPEEGPAHAEWREADRNMDGRLDMTEAAQALPHLIIIDLDNDGLVSRTEVEDALPGVRWEARRGDAAAGAADEAAGDAQIPHRTPPGGTPDASEGTARIIDEADYRMIVDALESSDRQRRIGTASPERSPR